LSLSGLEVLHGRLKISSVLMWLSGVGDDCRHGSRIRCSIAMARPKAARYRDIAGIKSQQSAKSTHSAAPHVYYFLAPEFFHQSPSSLQTASGVQLRRLRASRFSAVSPSKFVAVSTSCDRSMSSNVFTLNTAYRMPSITHVTIGITPHVTQT